MASLKLRPSSGIHFRWAHDCCRARLNTARHVHVNRGTVREIGTRRRTRSLADEWLGETVGESLDRLADSSRVRLPEFLLQPTKRVVVLKTLPTAPCSGRPDEEVATLKHDRRILCAIDLSRLQTRRNARTHAA
jgi:hypothetical protein